MTRILIPSLLFLLLAQPSRALDLGDLEAAREQAAVIDKVTALLEDESPSIRLSVFEEVMDDDDPILRSLAMEKALGGDDERLQTAAFRHLFDDREQLLVEVTLPPDPSASQSWLHQRWSGLALTQLAIDKSNDELSGRYVTVEYSNAFSGQVVRGGIRLRLPAPYVVCELVTRSVSVTTISGALECSIEGRILRRIEDGTSHAALPVRITLS